MENKQHINELKKSIEPILRKYQIKHATIVGSVAKGEEKANSDIDIVIQLKEDISLLEFAKIKIELEENLLRKVDLIEKSAIKPRLRNNLLKDEIPIF